MTEIALRREFQTKDWGELERQDWHLWLLAMLLILVLGISLLSLMFPLVYWGGKMQSDPLNQQVAFFGFSALLSLVLVYVMQRQAAIRRLKSQVMDARFEVYEAERAGHRRTFEALPDRSQFRDALAMAFRRASATGQPLVTAMFQGRDLSTDEIGRAAAVFLSLRKSDETIARVSDKTLGIIFPETQLLEAATVIERVRDMFSGSIPSAKIKIKLIPYPEDAETLAELEAPFRMSSEQEGE